MSMVVVALFMKTFQGPSEAAAAPKPAPILDALCKQKLCTDLNWANSTPKDRWGNALPGNAICVLALNQTVWLCVEATTTTCTPNKDGYIATCSGRYINENGQGDDCWYWAINC
jgi:hypothetical protein